MNAIYKHTATGRETYTAKEVIDDVRPFLKEEQEFAREYFDQDEMDQNAGPHKEAWYEELLSFDPEKDEDVLAYALSDGEFGSAHDIYYRKKGKA